MFALMSVKELVSLCLAVQEYIDTGAISLKDYDISVMYDEFINPSFENELQILGSAWSEGQISTKRYIDLLWGDRLSDEEKAVEMQEIENRRKEDDVKVDDFEDETPIGLDRLQ